MNRPVAIAWFSCGTASAVATKHTLERYGKTHEVIVIRMAIDEEHPDNDRFAIDCSGWFDHPIKTIMSRSAEDVWKRRRYMAGVNGGPCTSEIKIEERRRIVKQLQPEFQVFGYTAEEGARLARFITRNDGPPVIAPLIEAEFTKQMCHVAVADAGIRLPEMYRMGFPNNNCIGCVKANGVQYWNRVQRFFPDVFEARCKLSREIGCRLLKIRGKRRFLDEIGHFDERVNEDGPHC